MLLEEHDSLETDYVERHDEYDTISMPILHGIVFVLIVMLSGILFFGSTRPDELLMVLTPFM